jgi:hypothetical protein
MTSGEVSLSVSNKKDHCDRRSGLNLTASYPAETIARPELVAAFSRSAPRPLARRWRGEADVERSADGPNHVGHFCFWRKAHVDSPRLACPVLRVTSPAHGRRDEASGLQ